MFVLDSFALITPEQCTPVPKVKDDCHLLDDSIYLVSRTWRKIKPHSLNVSTLCIKIIIIIIWRPALGNVCKIHIIWKGKLLEGFKHPLLICFPYSLMHEVLITNWSLILNSVNIQKVLSVMKPGLFSEARYSFWIWKSRTLAILMKCRLELESCSGCLRQPEDSRTSIDK